MEELYPAIAELLGVDEDIIEMIAPYVDEQTGSSSDYIHYGYYCEFPNYDELDEEVIKEIENSGMKNKIPFGKTEYYSDSELGNTKADPFGWHADYEQEIYTLNHPTSKDEIINTLDSLKNKIDQYDDEILKKSLVLSAYSIIDGFVKSYIFDLIDKTNILNLSDITKDIFNETILNKLENATGRNQIYTRIKNTKLSPIPKYNQIRNILAHNICAVSIDGNNMCYEDKSNEIQRYSIDNLFRDFKDYIMKL